MAPGDSTQTTAAAAQQEAPSRFHRK